MGCPLPTQDPLRRARHVTVVFSVVKEAALGPKEEGGVGLPPPSWSPIKGNKSIRREF